MTDSIEAGSKALVLIVEEELKIVKRFEHVFSRYKERVEISVGRDAGMALDQLARRRPDLVILDIMLPYGSASEKLHGEDDREMRDTGIRLLEWIRTQESSGKRPLWIAVVTARSELGAQRRIRKALGANGHLFLKPTDEVVLEAALCEVLQIPCRLPAEIVDEARQTLARSKS